MHVSVHCARHDTLAHPCSSQPMRLLCITSQHLPFPVGQSGMRFGAVMVACFAEVQEGWRDKWSLHSTFQLRISRNQVRRGDR